MIRCPLECVKQQQRGGSKRFGSGEEHLAETIASAVNKKCERSDQDTSNPVLFWFPFHTLE